MSAVRSPAADADRSASADRLLDAQRHVLESILQGRALRQVLASLCEIVEAQSEREVRAAILLTDPQGERLYTGAAPHLPDSYNSAVDGLAIAPNVGTCCAAAARGEPVLTPSIASDPGWRELKHLPLALGLRGAWSMPIVSSAGKVLGTFGTYFFEEREPEPREQRLVEVLAPIAALAIERQRADETTRALILQQQFLANLDTATQPLTDPSAVMRVTARMTAEHFGADRCAYAEVEDESIFVITGDWPRGVPSIVGRWPVGAFGPACVRDMLAGVPYVVEDAETHAEIGPEYVPAYRATNIRAVICVPLHKQGRFTAAMAVHQSSPRKWTPAEIELVRLVVARCWEALERTRITRTLQQSEARYRAMVEASPECVKIVAADGTLLQMNAAGLRMIGASDARAAIGRNIYRVIAPKHRDIFRRFNERVCRGEGGTLQFEIVGFEGVRRSMETTAVPLPLEGGGYAQLAVTRDVTARVAADRALAESRARLDYAVQLSGVGFWYCELPFDVLHWDERVKGHFFLAPDARVTIDTFYERIHPEDREPTRQAIERSTRERAPYDVVYRTVDPDSGDVKWIRALGGTTFANDGTAQHFGGVTVDVTTQRLDQQRLRLLNEQLREQDRRKDEFLATLAHELRNPLAPIRTGLEILNVSNSAEQNAKVRQMMQRQLVHLVRMVDDLLDISRITLGKLTLQRERVDFRTVLHSALETSRPLIEAKAHELNLEVGADPLMIEGDPTRLAQIVSNLLNNAAKYTPRGGRIDVTIEPRDSQLIVRVKDNGLGIPESMLGAIFDMFTQVNRSLDRSQGGLGIGLTLVRRLVEMHGGSITAESAGLGLGSTFSVTLPLPPE